MLIKLKELNHIATPLQYKLWKIRNEVQRWNIDTNGKYDQQINKMEELLIRADVEGRIGEASKLQDMLKCKYEEREAILKQKSRSQWLKDGDNKTNFFHSSVKRRRWKNNVQGVRFMDEWITDPNSIKEIFAEHFEQRFKQNNTAGCFKIDGLQVKKINPKLAGDLETSFQENEIKAALVNIDPGKAPGPDAFNGFYIRKFWDILKKDILDFHSVFFEEGLLPRGINSSFLTLIPKTTSPKKVHDYRPISLINCTMKILLKLLAKRLQPILPSLVSDIQFAFIKGRQITDCILIDNEITHSIQRNKTQGVILKVDFKNAFDSVRWDFLLQVLANQGFEYKWRNWILGIISSTRISVLINGSPTKEFEMSKGLRQGDPLSPLLYILVSEILHVLIQKSREDSHN